MTFGVNQDTRGPGGAVAEHCRDRRDRHHAGGQDGFSGEGVEQGGLATLELADAVMKKRPS